MSRDISYQGSLRVVNTCTVVDQVAIRLTEFRELVKEVVRSACRTALLEEGFTPDDYFYDHMDSPSVQMNGRQNSFPFFTIQN